jgi:glycosyltransferase involved in cell wall biosynthesis
MSVTQIQYSVIICAHNSRPEYLGRVLESLRAQTLSQEQWELLLIDNASKEPLANKWDLRWHPHGRHIREEDLGLTPARLRGIKEAGGEWLVFVDDDNVLAADFLERVAAIAVQYPYLGTFGAGVIEPEFETTPSEEVAPFLHRLALRSVPTALWSNNHHDGVCPFGAGLAVHRRVVTFYYKLVQELKDKMILDRKGQQLSSNGDDLFSWSATKLGLGFGVFPELKLTHLIPAGRVSREYLLRLLREGGFSEALLYYLLLGIKPKPFGLQSIGKSLVQGVRGGSFGLRSSWAIAAGQGRAATFIAKNQISPLDCSALESAILNSTNDRTNSGSNHRP